MLSVTWSFVPFYRRCNNHSRGNIIGQVREGSPPISLQHTCTTSSSVISSAQFALGETNIVRVNPEGVQRAAEYISRKIVAEQYTPRTWRAQPLHICPPEPYSPSNPLTTQCLNWIFLISALNFSFWSEKEGTIERYGVEWRKGWDTTLERSVHTGYWSLVAALNRALEENIPITDPAFYSSEYICPDSLISHVFRAAPHSTEQIPLLKERIAIMREVGFILCTEFGGSYFGFLEAFQKRHRGRGTAFDLAQMVTDAFPSFRDEQWLNGQRILFWKRPQILVAETWAAFYPKVSTDPHPIFPSGPSIGGLTMFADYRVPQILHHLCILEYPSSLVKELRTGTCLAPGSREEISLRAASIIAVEHVRQEILRFRDRPAKNDVDKSTSEDISSVLIDFYLWDLAKKIERGEEQIQGVETADMVPAHRTRSIWY
ncbi:hypothetical protein SCLCIDRAFT_1221986 [Scleroderma citrinum Foug A]|uniref:Queuosine 5'-phosphate N-glycosylase/hydrolase n=1 Tax=Scleroderma citrinum Foug A TaxID=1036808 RepID=A0A0C2YXZ5_9AGAM|nr:hypothetical protein SCLCIDRAFT_1221986 [Scleroderma citrinum Foug A]